MTQQYRCIAEDKDVPRSELVKAYEFEKDRYVTFTRKSSKALEETASGAIEITEFVDQKTVDPVYYERAYFLAPDKAAQAYALLTNAMRESGRTAIGRWAARGKQYLVQLRVVEHGLVLQTVAVRARKCAASTRSRFPKQKLNDTELKLAKQLIDSITTDSGFDASNTTTT